MVQRQGEWRRIRVGSGYGAAVLAFAYAIVSVYWALGGTTGLRTLGTPLETLAHSRTAGAMLLAWSAAVIKFLCGLLIIALLRNWKLPVPRRLLFLLGQTIAFILIAYGAVLVSAEAFVVFGVIHPGSVVQLNALRWHLLLWDMWFLVWGILQAVALAGTD